MNQFKRLREAAGLTQKSLADRMGTTTAQVSRLENGERRLNDHWAKRIGQALDVEPWRLFAEESDTVQHHVPIRGTVPSGPWIEMSVRERPTPLEKRQSVEWEDYVLYDGDLKAKELFALQVKGTSMNRVVLEGYFVILRNIEGAGLTQAALDNKVVLVHDTQTNTCTLKRYNHSAQTYESDSTDPSFRSEPTRLGQRIIAVAVEYKRQA